MKYEIVSVTMLLFSLGVIVGAGTAFDFEGETEDIINPQKCEQDIENLGSDSDGRTICTFQTAVMQCPHDPEFTYQASNGCEIGELEEKGWTKVN